MKEIPTADITDTVARLCKEANYFLGEDVLSALKKAREAEESPVARQVLDHILENADIAAREEMPLCQDCGLAIVFLDIGQDVHITGAISMRRSTRVCDGVMPMAICGNRR